jgi:DNA-binding CsgD family transcriptional regulator
MSCYKIDDQDIKDIYELIDITNNHQQRSKLVVEFLKGLSKVFKAERIIFYFSDSNNKKVDLTNVIKLGLDDYYHRLYQVYYNQLDPFPPITTRVPNRLVARIQDILSYSKWNKLEYYNDFCRPQNVYHEMGLQLLLREKLLGAIALFRSKGEKGFTNKEVCKAKLCIPYLATALENTPILAKINNEDHLINNIGTKFLAEDFRLSKREIELTKYVSMGLTNEQIADKLFISKYTVHHHLQNIFEKTGVDNRTSLAKLVYISQ